jgi:hypothetical protein
VAPSERGGTITLAGAGFTNFTTFLIRILLSFYHVAQAPRRTLVGLYQHIPTNSVGESRPWRCSGIGGAHEQTSERAAPTVSEKEKGKATGEKKKIAIISAYEHTKLKLTVFILLGGPQNTIKSHLVFTG